MTTTAIENNVFHWDLTEMADQSPYARWLGPKRIEIRLPDIGGDNANIYKDGNTIMLQIGCQNHSLKKWREEGVRIIAEQICSVANPLKPTDVDGAIYGNTKESVEESMSRIRQLVERRTAEHDKYLTRARRFYSRLSIIMDFIDSMMTKEPDIEEEKKKEAKEKELASPVGVKPSEQALAKAPAKRRTARR